VENRPFNDIPAQVNQTFLETGDALVALAARTAQVDRVVTEAAYSLLLACGRLTAADLGLPVDREDLDANYRATSWQPWGLWIGTDYPESPVTSDDDWP